MPFNSPHHEREREREREREKEKEWGKEERKEGRTKYMYTPKHSLLIIILVYVHVE